MGAVAVVLVVMVVWHSKGSDGGYDEVVIVALVMDTIPRTHMETRPLPHALPNDASLTFSGKT